MTFNALIALFSTMIVLAAIPSISVLAVSTKSATFGFIHGVFTTLGIILGDIIFILIALGGLSFFAETLGGLFILIKYLGATYLIVLGIGLCRSKSNHIETKTAVESSLISSFLTGLLITLGDQKAILFYLGFFPAFLDISKISYGDILIIILMSIVAVGGVKLGYALMAHQARLLMSSKIEKRISIMAGCMMILIGIFLMVKNG